MANMKPLVWGTNNRWQLLQAGDVLDTSITGSATSLTTARTLTIGSTGKAFDGSANVSWTPGEMGVLPDNNPSATGNFTLDGTNPTIYLQGDAASYYPGIEIYGLAGTPIGHIKGYTNNFLWYYAAGTNSNFFENGQSGTEGSLHPQVHIKAAKNSVGLFIGDQIDTSGYGNDNCSPVIRFNGQTVAWGDIGYFPAADSAHGNFRFMTTDNAVSNVANASVAGLLFISTAATGVPPLRVASTTLVTNLNADLLDGQHGAYYLDAANFTGTLPAASLPAVVNALGSLPNAAGALNNDGSGNLSWSASSGGGTPGFVLQAMGVY